MKPMLIAAVVIALGAMGLGEITGPGCKGVLYGAALTEEGQAVAGIRLLLYPPGVNLSYMLPTTRTDGAGQYRLEHVCPGKYTVLVDDEAAGYPDVFIMWALSEHSKVKLTKEHQDAEVTVHVPPRAALLQVVGLNSRTNAAIPAIEVTLRAKGSHWVTVLPVANKPLLIPSNTDLLCRVAADGYREWQESKKKGKQIRFLAEEHVTLTVELQPAR